MFKPIIAGSISQQVISNFLLNPAVSLIATNSFTDPLLAKESKENSAWIPTAKQKAVSGFHARGDILHQRGRGFASDGGKGFEKGCVDRVWHGHVEIKR